MRSVVSILILLALANTLSPGCSGGINITLPPQNEIPPEVIIPPQPDPSNRTDYFDPDADTFLGEGHPIEGVNYRRNNRSPYLLPASLGNSESIAPFFYEKYHNPYTVINYEKYNALVIDGNEKLYLGRCLYYTEQWQTIIQDKKYNLCSFVFGEDLGTEQEGGGDIILTGIGVFSYSLEYYYKSSMPTGGTGYAGGHRSNWANLCKYGEWPELSASTTECWSRWWDVYNYVDYKTGDWSSRRFSDFLPLPDRSLLVAFSRDDSEPPTFLQVLDENLEVILEFEVEGRISGFAFDTGRSVTYISTEAGLYSHSWGFGEIWNTTSIAPEFSDNIPVISDDGGILGCLDGTLRHIGPDGTPGPGQPCGAYLRPSILGDGTIAIITDSTIKYFDEGLNEVGEIPLPSGPDSGELYIRPPLVDAVDNMALFAGQDLFIINRAGNILAQRTFDSDISEIRLGPEHLFVALDYEIFRFPH